MQGVLRAAPTARIWQTSAVQVRSQLHRPHRPQRLPHQQQQQLQPRSQQQRLPHRQGRVSLGAQKAKKDWETKCSWKKCASCDDCSVAPAPATTSSPSPTPKPSGATGLPCTKHDDCESNTHRCGADCTVSGNRPNCQCSNGCVWGVTCTRDAVVVAQWIFSPDNHCGGDGSCTDGTKKAGSDYKKRVCISYHDGKFYPESSGAGYCLGIYEKNYADWIVTVNPRTKTDFEKAYTWSMTETGLTPSQTPPSRDAGQQCTDFGYCYGHARASGTDGSCSCSGCEKFTGARCDKWSWGPSSGTFTE